jgi:transposase-like protein
MTDDRMVLIELIEKSADIDLVREMLSFAAERLMDAEVETRTGAAHGVRDPARQVQRNGYRERVWNTRAGQRSPGSVGAVTFPSSWSRGAPRRRR